MIVEVLVAFMMDGQIHVKTFTENEILPEQGVILARRVVQYEN